MQFLRRNQHFLLTLAVLVLASVLVVNQFLARQSAHAQRLEDFILLPNGLRHNSANGYTNGSYRSCPS